eukprot:CAMPEP_0196772850 /NCGR_PEP_ID=MMETSP1104-20130614/2456_1 /TAXON_ID=33652 /ORGANISM="Cafeteria sp., Strain Caron Lab Isolate" /LENGTH=118 /DNA_ID=CAMNT_0042142993 /DNA_START=62 /DNA_END=415 /DNA_ORIENTATION=+
MNALISDASRVLKGAARVAQELAKSQGPELAEHARRSASHARDLSRYAGAVDPAQAIHAVGTVAQQTAAAVAKAAAAQAAPVVQSVSQQFQQAAGTHEPHPSAVPRAPSHAPQPAAYD